MRDDVVAMLAAFGVVGSAYDPIMDMVVKSVTLQITNATNQPTVPDELSSVAVRMAAGEYLTLKKSVGQLESFDLDAAVKQIKEGDTSITFAIGEGSATPEQRLDRLIDYLINGHKTEIYSCRRLAW